MTRQIKLSAGIVAAGLLALLPAHMHAQSADALIDKLVQKGILSVKEANELREETDKNFKESYTVKTGLPDWVNTLKLSGDVRLRYEGFNTDALAERTAGGQQESITDRNRFRYRLRFGATVSMFDNLEAGFRLTSAEPKSTSDNAFYGGDPISGNTSFENNGSKKFIYIDQVYAKWYALNGPTISSAIIGGKMENPFVFSDMVFDQDYTPEGAAITSGFRINDQHSLKLNLGGFIIDELSTSSSDPYMAGAQLRYDANPSKQLSATAGLSYLAIQNPSALVNNAVPNINGGNTRANNALVYDYTPIIVDASVTYSLASFPLYKGAFPIKVGGEYMNNPGAPSSIDNYAWNVGVMLGKSGKRGTWDLSYAYKWLGGDAWYEEFVDSDFGAIYARRSPSQGAAAGYVPGTNVKGHIFRLAYSPTDSLTLSGKWFLTELLQPFPAGTESQVSRLQVDAALKF